MTQTIRAVVFDFGGVLTLTPGPGHWAVLLREIGGENGEARLAAFQAGYQAGRDAYDRGDLSAGDYWAEILREIGGPVDERLGRRLFELDTAAWTRGRAEVLDWAAALRAAGLRTGILSNMPSDVLAAIEGPMEWLEEFSPRLYSCRLGLIKPEPAIYRALLSELALPPREILFLDDRAENVQAARALGLSAEQFDSLPELLPIAAERYGLPDLQERMVREGARA